MSNINKAIDYNDIDVFINTVNKQIEYKKKEEEKRRADEMAQRAMYNSVGNSVKRIMEEEKRSKELEKERKKKILISVGSALLTCSITFGLIAANIDSWNAKLDAQKRSTMDYIESCQVLLDNNLAYHDPQRQNPFVIADNSVKDYKKLNITSPRDVYSYMIAFERNKEEFNDFIKSVYYIDEDNNIQYYKSFEDFLNRNGYLDKEDFMNKIKKEYQDEIMQESEKNKNYSNLVARKGGK